MSPKPSAPGRLRLPRWLTVVLAFVLLGGWYLNERQVREAYVYMGLPKAQGFSGTTFYRVLRNDGFMVGYSDVMGQPLWATYRLKPIEAHKNLPRPDRFKSDVRALDWVGHDDYTGSGFDRGHLAPNYAISQLYGREAQLETFLMTNVSPQKPNLNQKVWQRLEEAATDAFTPQFGEVWVVVGPVFEPPVKRMASGKVAIPGAFFALFAVPGNEPKMMAFLIPQSVRGNEKLADFAVTVDEVEARTGLDFFWRLEDPIETALEGQNDAQAWPIPQTTKNRF